MNRIHSIISPIGTFLKKRWYIFIIVFVVAGFFIQNKKVTQAKEEEKTMYVVQTETLKESLSLSGKIDASEKATLRFQTGGRLSWVGVKEGDTVKKYQGIASLDQREVEKQLQKNLNLYMKSRWNYEQTKQDNKEAEYKDGDIGDKMKRLIDQSQFDLNNSVLDLELKAIAKEYAFLSTPIAGIVTKAEPSYAGVNISPAQAEYEVINPETLYFSASVDQTEVVKLSLGQKGEIMFDAYPDVTFPASIEDISYMPKKDETGTVYEVKIFFNSTDIQQYRLGMTGDIEFTLREKKDIIAIPAQYIRNEGNKKYVMKKNGNEKQKIEVQTGLDVDGEIEIIQGLYTGDIIYEFAK